jgi:hypothetical protein
LQLDLAGTRRALSFAQAALVIDQQMKGEMSYQEAEEVAVYEILARGDGRANMEDPAPEPLSYQEKEQIYRKLEAPENAHVRVVGARSQRQT